ncbi:MAG TPA: glycosyltransferase [Terracidiphilus sp.]|nr:glycosyltransferase [Terracidiphilus sp.]
MRIAYILTSLGIGGAEKQAISIGERMAGRGHQVLLIVLRSPEKQEWPTNLLTIHLGMKRSGPDMVGGFLRARRTLRSFKPDLLHSHTFPANMMARALRAAGVSPVVLTTIHNIYEGGGRRDFAYRMTDSFSTYTTAVSESVANRNIAARTVPRGKCSVITNGIDTERFSPSAIEARKEDTRKRFLWLSAGRDTPAKDFDNLLTAFREVRAQMPNAQLWIAGCPASYRDIGGRSEINGVQWLGISEEMPRTISDCDGFVLGSAWEGMPLVIGEAMAMEKPVVATNVGGVRELIGDAGMLVPSRNSQALAQAMLRMMRMPECERALIGQAARERIRGHFEINWKADEWEGLYTHILSEHR